MASDHKSVLITYPKDTPASVLDQAKQSIKDAGGVITHEYNLIKGFAAQASPEMLNTVSTLETSHKPTIEDDNVISINKD